MSMRESLVGEIVGTSVQRVEDRRILTGTGRYVDDVTYPGMLHAAFVRSTEPHARIVRIDVEEARKAPGVVAVYTSAEMSEITSPSRPMGGGGRGPKSPTVPTLPDDKVRFVGDPVVMVVAESRYLAEDAGEMVEIDYDPLDPIATAEHALDPSRPPLFDDLGDNVITQGSRSWGDPDAAFASADRVVSATFVQHRHANVPMETRGGVASFDTEAGELTYHMATQGPHGVRMALSGLVGLPNEKIRVLAGDVGGAFGQKIGLYREDVAVCAASKQLGRPVKWIEDRIENLSAAGQAREETLEVEAAVRNDGTLLGLKVRMVVQAGAYPVGMFNIAAAIPNMVSGLLPGPYRLDGYTFDHTVVMTNKCPYVAYRGPWEAETWVRERTLDVIARELGIDPAEVRRKNMVRPDEGARLITGRSLEGVTSLESFERALERVDYPSLRAEQERARQEGRYLGIGFATFIEAAPGPVERPAGGRGGGGGEQAHAILEPDGGITVITSQAPHGQGHETTLAQVAAQEMGVPFEQVRVLHGDTNITPFSFLGTGGSRAATFATGSVLHSTRSLKKKILEVAGDLFEISPEDLEVVAGTVTAKGVPQKSMSLQEVASRLGEVEGAGSQLRATEAFAGPERGGWSGGTHLCVLEVDADTGIVEIKRYVVVEDCGKMVNPAVVEGQVRGGTAQGIGAVLYERSAYDPESGQYLAPTFMDYLIPTASEIPDIEIIHIESEPLDEVDFRGVGEGGAIVAPAAVTNALEDALAPFGVRVGEQHLPPNRILELIGKV